MALLSVLALVASALVGFSDAQVNPGWQYGDDLVTKTDASFLTIPLAPLSTVPNPLTPQMGKPVQLPLTTFTGKFQELDERSDRSTTGADARYYQNFNYRQVTPKGDQFEFQYDPNVVIPNLFPYVKSLLQRDTTTSDLADSFLLSSNANPGSNYTCLTDASMQSMACKKNTVRRRRYIFGTDNRSAVGASRYNYPYRTVGIVGNHCTGTLVGPRHVLTAGHCVHSGPGGDWIADLSFRPAYDKDGGASAAPYGKIAWVRATTTSAWANSGNWNSDYAIIELASSPGVGWMSFGYHSGINSGWNMNMNGYPGSTLWGKMYHHYGQLLTANSENLQYRTIDMVKGTSGSGVYLYTASSGFRRIYGVNNVQYWVSGDAKAASDNYIAGHTSPSWNQAVRITSSKFSRICGWINDPSIGC